ncbi:MAG: hypothetical protein US86_C0001G0424 [Candidatus Daviesbacteria bacterium GW2011_GWA2_38_24]|uniref:DNA polymerase III delta N-terminal domain-containing protein n=1 Tax=Candidatus Daviesbacteria bacterium GW2011_GWA2_38_24 TaxID=1618422 RepID=A0A0G0JKV1_9BACT|nr:MAG: hypothetical protein US86_C0001G0424 [Candidatus Daviesbacteria bacterium GW2011_GWA2_38_24]KKQ79206.1 MAG: hypothetical protein UT01_C0047G0007 [Candidatus Daviesbacteria bacterium GW2011_GWA1_38_7]OGE22814.1 MAG: hypothetical protein A2688_02915 [Candidatus Daviesbacteria bacterium RIFCSPHIGHO2_01_FULL_38_8]
MITLIHGTDQVLVLNKLLEIKQSNPDAEISEFEGSEIDLKLEFRTSNLFSDKRLIIINNPDMKLNLLQLQEQNGVDVVLLFSKPLPLASEILKVVKEKKGVVFEFKERQDISIFPFLDALIEKKKKAFLDLDKLLNIFGSQYILTMIFYSLRKLILPSKSSSPFAKQKIEQQKKLRSLDDLERLYKETLDLDFKIKKGAVENKIGLTLLVQKFLS